MVGETIIITAHRENGAVDRFEDDIVGSGDKHNRTPSASVSGEGMRWDRQGKT